VAGASHALGDTAVALLEDTIGVNLERTAARVPGAEALVACHQGARFSWESLNAAVDRLASGLLGLGLERGDRLGIWSPNRYEWTLVQYATAKLGLILVNVNPAYRTSELEYVLRQSGCRALVAAPEFKGADYGAMVDQVRDRLSQLEHVVLLDSPRWNELAAGENGPGRAAVAARMTELGCHDPINIQYTSGTTGSPKGATLTHHNILNNALLQSGILGYTEADRVCIPVPLYHCFGMVLGNLACSLRGACMVYPDAAFDPERTLAAVAEERCTSLYGVPTMFIGELDHPRFSEFDLSSLRTGIMAGSPCPIEVMRRVDSEMGIDEMTIAFGMTETSPASTMVRRDDTLEHRCGTVGQVMPHTEIKIVDPGSGETVPRDDPGEFCARGYLVMSGYWDDEERTAEAIDADGWMHTGDLATMDADGYVRIVGRIKDMIIRGGENVYPREIEEFLHGHPAVADVQVVGVPDDRYGEQIVAWVIPAQGASADEDELREHCRGQIAHFKVPRHFVTCDEFPMTVTGKIQKHKLREEAVERLGGGVPGS
jgi:fatty-acyl-CoA synthase